MDSPVQISRELSKIDLNQLKLVLKGVNLMDLHLQYRGEGNENLVFSLADVGIILFIMFFCSLGHDEIEERILLILIISN